MKTTRAFRSCFAVSMLLWASPSLAQKISFDEPGEAPPEKPWSKGVPLDARSDATELFNEGRKLYHDSLFFLAAEKYRAALERCNCHHPAAHYNLALSLLSLDKPVEMRENLVLAIDNGLDLLGKVQFEHAKNYKTVLESQLVRFHIRCDVPGAHVSLDGEELFTPPGEAERWAKAGHHVVAATKNGFMANQVARAFAPGARPSLELKLNTQEELTVYTRRWSQALPWSFVGGGAAVALVGGGLFYAGHQTAKGADSSLRGLCPEGCKPAPSGDSTRRTAGERLQKVAIGAVTLGGAALLTGGVLLYLNRAHTSVRPYEPEVAEAAHPPALSLAPLLDKEIRGVAATGAF
jgi:hypothetical protein